MSERERCRAILRQPGRQECGRGKPGEYAAMLIPAGSLLSRPPGIWRNTSEEGSQLQPPKAVGSFRASQIILDVA